MKTKHGWNRFDKELIKNAYKREEEKKKNQSPSNAIASQLLFSYNISSI